MYIIPVCKINPFVIVLALTLMILVSSSPLSPGATPSNPSGEQLAQGVADCDRARQDDSQGADGDRVQSVLASAQFFLLLVFPGHVGCSVGWRLALAFSMASLTSLTAG